MATYNLSSSVEDIAKFTYVMGTVLQQAFNNPVVIPGAVVSIRELEASQLYPYLMGLATLIAGVSGQPWDGQLVDDDAIARALFNNLLRMVRNQVQSI